MTRQQQQQQKQGLEGLRLRSLKNHNGSVHLKNAPDPYPYPYP